MVVDGGSRDGTIEIARRVPDVTALVSAGGRAVQMNAGARAAHGRVLLFLHADTWLPDGALAAVEDALADPAVVGGRFDVRFDSPRPVLSMIAFFMNLRSRASGISTGDQAIFVRRDVFDGLGGFAEIPLMEDVELTKRLKRRGRVVALRARVTTAARKWQREGALRTMALMWALRFLYACGVKPARLHRWYYRRDP